MPIYNKDNQPIDAKTDKVLKSGKYRNIPAYLITVIIIMISITGGVMFASEKLADYLITEFSFEVVNLK
jgi:cytochrome b subunit of formate dehydrogenase